MRKQFLLLLIILTFTFTFSFNQVQAKDFSYAEAVPFIGLENVAQIIKTTVFCIQSEGNLTNDKNDDDWILHGTGFFLNGENNEIIGVTCKHVILPFIEKNKIPYAGFDTDKGYYRLRCDIKHIDNKFDVALMKFKNPKESITVKNNVFKDDQIDTDNNSIIEGRGVVIIGYPLSLGIEDDENYPVVRRGIVAQFTGKNHFLVDGFASPGNSGSPVFSLKYKERKLVGMATAYINDRINLYDEKGIKTAAIPYNSGLAKVLTMKTIKEIVDNNLK